MIGEQLDIQGKLKPVERQLGTLKKHLEQSDIYFKYKGKKRRKSERAFTVSCGRNSSPAGYGAITDRTAGIVNAYYRRPILVFYLHDRLEVMVQSYHGNINHILDELINVSIQAYSANTLVAQ